MTYYKKNNTVYCKVDVDTNTYVEVFSLNDQTRVMIISDPVLYSSFQTRLTDHQFEQSNASEFESALATAVAKFTE